MRLPRFRLWLLMVLVALAGIAMFGVNIVRTRRLCDTQIARHQAMEQSLREECQIELGGVERGNTMSLFVLDAIARVRALHVMGDPLIDYEATAVIKVLNKEYRGWAALVSGSMEGMRQKEGMIEYHVSMRRKYEQAKKQPWLSISPDPPEPSIPVPLPPEIPGPWPFPLIYPEDPI